MKACLYHGAGVGARVDLHWACSCQPPTVWGDSLLWHCECCERPRSARRYMLCESCEEHQFEPEAVVSVAHHQMEYEDPHDPHPAERRGGGLVMSGGRA